MALQRNGLDDEELAALQRLGLEGRDQELLMAMAVAAKRTRAYQATPQRNVRKILSGGLDPAKGGRGASKRSKELVAASRHKVHFTTLKGTAEAYQGYFEGRQTFLGDPAKRPLPAEVLKLALPVELAATAAADPDSLGWSESYTTPEAIPPELVRGTAPTPAGKGDARRHHARGEAELQAIVSHWPEGAPRLDPDDPDDLVRLHVLRKVLQSVVIPGDGPVPARTFFD